MLKKLLLTSALILGIQISHAQPSMPKSQIGTPDGGIMEGIEMTSVETSFMLKVNPMNEEKKTKLNKVASNYRNQNRSVLTDIAGTMLGGGVPAVMTVIGTEINNLTQIRTKQKNALMEMRRKECSFVDSLQSVKGQSDFYSKLSNHGPLDPSDMNFDGITLRANKGNKEVLRMVCHIDTTKFEYLFLHSKFYLVVDTLIFYPYRSFLPNLKANHIRPPRPGKSSQEEIEIWNTMSQFDFEERQSLTVNIKMDVYSSWINELVQVYQDVKLGTFSINIPIDERELKDSVYVYYRGKAIAEKKPIINVNGDCFVVPRSYMPVSAKNPSWGTGEYKMKVVLSEKCKYNPSEERSKNWHRDYKQLVRLQNDGKVKNEYWEDIETTFRDNYNTILKATYTPVINGLTSMMGIKTTGNAVGKAGGMAGGMSGATGGSSPKANGGMSGTGNQGK